MVWSKFEEKEERGKKKMEQEFKVHLRAKEKMPWESTNTAA